MQTGSKLFAQAIPMKGIFCNICLGDFKKQHSRVPANGYTYERKCMHEVHSEHGRKVVIPFEYE